MYCTLCLVYGCTTCCEMENRVWSDPELLKRLRETFVVVALHVAAFIKFLDAGAKAYDNNKNLRGK